MGADSVIDPVRLTMNNANTAIVSPKVFGGNLRHRGFKTLADRGAAGNDFNKAFIVDENLGAI